MSLLAAVAAAMGCDPYAPSEAEHNQGRSEMGIHGTL